MRAPQGVNKDENRICLFVALAGAAFCEDGSLAPIKERRRRILDRGEPMNDTIRLLKELIRFKTVSGRHDEIARCARFIGNFLDDLSLSWSLLEQNGVPSILVTPEEGFAPVLLMSHMDVVDGPDELFVPFEEDGRLYGRGSIDDKYAVAVSLMLLKKRIEALRALGLGQSALPFGVLITGDEETGGFDGAASALKNVKTRFCIALDGGCPEKIVVKEKGILQLKLISRGVSAHGARPWLGKNAIDGLVDDLAALRGLFAFEEEDHWHRTLNVGKIFGGAAVNQVPDLAEASLDIRYTEEDDPDALVARIREAVAGEVVVELKEPLFDGGKSPYLEMLEKAAGHATVGSEHGASDARFLAALGIPGAVWGADGQMSQHSAREYVLISSVRAIMAGLDRFITLSEAVT